MSCSIEIEVPIGYFQGQNVEWDCKNLMLPSSYAVKLLKPKVYDIHYLTNQFIE